MFRTRTWIFNAFISTYHTHCNALWIRATVRAMVDCEGNLPSLVLPLPTRHIVPGLPYSPTLLSCTPFLNIPPNATLGLRAMPQSPGWPFFPPILAIRMYPSSPHPLPQLFLALFSSSRRQHKTIQFLSLLSNTGRRMVHHLPIQYFIKSPSFEYSSP